MANPAPGFTKHPNYAVDIKPLKAELVVKAGEINLVRTQKAVILQETKHRDVWYVPLDELSAAHIRKTDTQTYCPFKGYASYWSVCGTDGEVIVDDAIWAYESPYDECKDIANFASFYTNKLDLYLDGVLANKAGPGWTE